MSELMTPIPFRQLMTWITAEHRREGSVFGVHRPYLAGQKSLPIFGERIDRMHEEAPENQVHIQRYLSADCFGDYYTRGGLDVKTRELLTFSMLVSLGGCEAQVKGHIQGNANVGNGKATLLAVVTQLLPYIGYPRTLNAIACLNEVIPE